MLVEMTKTTTVLLEGHITLTIRAGTRVDLADDVANKGISEGWCIAVDVAPGPDETAVVRPAEVKRKKAS